MKQIKLLLNTQPISKQMSALKNNAITSLSKKLFLSEQKDPIRQLTEQQGCEVCKIKQKFSFNENAKCIKHKLMNDEELNQQKSNENHEGQLHNYDLPAEILSYLEDAEAALNDYWNNLHDQSQGKLDKVQKDLEPIIEVIAKIQERLSYFIIPNQPKHQHQPKHYDLIETFQEKKIGTKSEKFINISNFSDIFGEENIVPDQIKEWVFHFHKILQNRTLNQAFLPYEESLDMKIFKDSMERKFITYANSYTKFQKKLQNSLEKLLFYMQKCEGKVPEDKIASDITFIEEESQIKKQESSEKGNNELLKCLLIQAFSLQNILQRLEERGDSVNI